MKLSFREKALLISFIIVGLGYLYYNFLYNPLQSEMAVLVRENQILQSQIKTTADHARQNFGIINNAKENQQQKGFQDQVIKVPGEILLPEALLYLQNSARTSGVTVMSLVFTPEAAAADNSGGATEVKISLTAKGGYLGLKGFLLKIHEAPRLYRIDAVRMVANNGPSARTTEAPATNQDSETGAAPLPPEVKREITINVDMVTFYQEFNAPGFKDDQERVPPGGGQDNPFAI